MSYPLGGVGPGSGFRLLSDSELVRSGDEYLGVGGRWALSSGLCRLPYAPYRRRADAVIPGDGYRLLDPGEEPRAGDQYLSLDRQVWKYSFGRQSEGTVYGRPIYRRRLDDEPSPFQVAEPVQTVDCPVIPPGFVYEPLPLTEPEASWDETEKTPEPDLVREIEW